MHFKMADSEASPAHSLQINLVLGKVLAKKVFGKKNELLWKDLVHQ